MAEAEGRALGKLVLCGEHAVVHGHPALAVAIDRSTTVRLLPADGPTRLARGEADARLARALAAALPPRGLEVHIESDLPRGRGMGSSAALAVALVRARAAFEGRSLDEATTHAEAFALERIFHGDPSGLDHAVAALGGTLRYRRGPPAELVRLPAPKGALVVLDSQQAGDTSALVARVAAGRPANDPLLSALGALTSQVESCLDEPSALGPLLTEAHGLLRALGVSTPRLDALVQLALEAGALGAKLSGAGGGGVVLALTERPENVMRAAAERSVPAVSCRPVEAP